jgi:drug/metabolite transporter (DMT)-like permease
LAAAFMYTIHVVRLGQFAMETAPLMLAAFKATTEAVLSCAFVALCLWSTGSDSFWSAEWLAIVQGTGHEIISFTSAMTAGISSGDIQMSALLPAAGATLWTGWVTCAYTIYAQSFGQSRVSPTEANLIYSFQPVFTALFAWVLLGETLGPAGYLGGGLIGSAVYIAATSATVKPGAKDDSSSILESMDVAIATEAEEAVCGD